MSTTMNDESKPGRNVAKDAGNGAETSPNGALTLATKKGTLLPLTPSTARLKNVKQVRLELARLYRETRQGIIHPDDAAKLGYLLDRIRVCIVDHELEERVTALERQQGG